MGVSLFLVFCHLCFASMCGVAGAAVYNLTANESLKVGETLVSPTKRFQLGFISYREKWFLGITYESVPRTLVWIGKGNHRIGGDGELMVSRNGTLILQCDGAFVKQWRPKRRPRMPVLVLLDSGNLVVGDGSDISGIHYWESFAVPSYASILRTKVGSNLMRGVMMPWTSWNVSSNVPSEGTLKFEVQSSEPQPQAFYNQTKEEFGLGPWDSVRFVGKLDGKPIAEPVFTFKVEKRYYTFQLKDNSEITRLVVKHALRIKYLKWWGNSSITRVLMMSLCAGSCDPCSQCGPNGICNRDDDSCECLKGFSPTVPLQWAAGDSSGGCTRNLELVCDSRNQFVSYGGLSRLPDHPNLLSTNSSLQECHAACLKNCSCMAHTYFNPKGKGNACLMWFGELLNMTASTVGNKTLNIRMAAPELEFERNNHLLLILEMAGLAISGLLLYCICGWSIRRRAAKKIAKSADAIRTNSSERLGEENPRAHYYDLATICAATNSFCIENEIGKGGFGTVYKGVLPSGQEVAVKRLSRGSLQGLQEFKNEVTMVTQLQHQNLIRLLGCCIHESERMLVYEYMPNKSLDNFLFDEDRRKLLTWSKRFAIVKGIALGLRYLHQESRVKIIHRDLKTSNILLDNEMNPKVSDFGLATIIDAGQPEEQTKRIMGTYGYMSPEYAMTGEYSIKSDVYSFGVLILEIVHGRRNWGFRHPDHGLNLLGHAWKLWTEGKPLQLMDESIEESSVDQVLTCIYVALLSVQPCAEDRPTISTVISMLINETRENKEPVFPGESYLMRMPALDSQSAHTINQVTLTVLDGR